MTRIDFAPGHEDERLTEQDVAAKLRLMKLAGRMLAALKEAQCALGLMQSYGHCNGDSHGRDVAQARAVAAHGVISALIAEAEGHSLQEQA